MPKPETDQTITIDLRYRPPAEVLEAIAPHVEALNLTVSAFDDRILLRGPTSEVGAAIDLILNVDIPPRQLWVTVAPEDGNATPGGIEAPEPAVSGMRLATGGPPGPGPGVGDHASSRHWGTRRSEGHRILVREGDWAVVAVQPRPQRSALPAKVQVTPRIEVFTADLMGLQRSRAEGFRVRPRLSGDRVNLELARFQSADDPLTREPVVQTLATTLTGRLGEWIRVGGPARHQAAEITPGAGVAVRTRAKGLPGVLVKVELADPGVP